MQMELRVMKEMQKIWKRFLSDTAWDNFSVDIEMHKKLLSYFQPGDCYYFILNVRTGILEYLSPEVEKILGYPHASIDLGLLFDLFHPDDKPYFLNFESAISKFYADLPKEKRFKYKSQYDFRFRKADGNYIRLLNQIIILQYEEEGQHFRTFGVQTDISHLKKDQRPSLSIIGSDGEPSYYDVDVKEVFKPSGQPLTSKEKIVLALLMDGKISKEIGAEMNISKSTVDSHRRNMLNKTNCRSTSELVNKAMINGWIAQPR